jgi:hypothetical protein
MDEIKKAYRSLAKECHPDYLGDEGHNICILLNEAYEVRLKMLWALRASWHQCPRVLAEWLQSLKSRGAGLRQ